MTLTVSDRRQEMILVLFATNTHTLSCCVGILPPSAVSVSDVLTSFADTLTLIHTVDLAALTTPTGLLPDDSLHT